MRRHTLVECMEAWQHNTQTALGNSQFVRTLAENSHRQAPTTQYMNFYK